MYYFWFSTNFDDVGILSSNFGTYHDKLEKINEFFYVDGVPSHNKDSKILTFNFSH